MNWIVLAPIQPFLWPCRRFPAPVLAPLSGPPAVRETEGGNHGHFPDLPQIHTGFVGWGVGFRSGAVLASMGIEDIAPLISELFGIPFEAPDGVSPKCLLAVQA